MTSPARSTRTLEDRARFGLGVDTQDDNVTGTTEVPLTAEGVIESEETDFLNASDVVVADAGGYFATDTVEAHLANINKYAPWLYQQGSDIVIDSDSSGGGNGVGATPAATDMAAPVRAGFTYLVEARVNVTATVNGGVELSFTAPAAATLAWSASIFQAAGNIVETGKLDLATGAVNYKVAALSYDHIDIVGELTVAGTAGTLTLLAAQDTAHADNTTIHGESFLRVTVLR